MKNVYDKNDGYTPEANDLDKKNPGWIKTIHPKRIKSRNTDRMLTVRNRKCHK